MRGSENNRKPTSHLNRWLLTGTVLGLALSASPLQADETSGELKALRQQIEALSQKVQLLEQKNASDQEALGQVKILQRKTELEQEAIAEKAKTAPTVSVGASGLQVRSADSNFVFGIHGYLQADARFGVGDAAGPYTDTFLMRRIRPIFDGTLYKIVDYKVMLDFGTGISSSTSNDGFVQDAYANIRFLPELQLQVGKMKEPVGLERLQSGANLLFIERAAPTLLVPNRNVGVELQGDLFGQKLSYQAGVFNGAADGGSADFQSFDDGNLAGRLFTHPFKDSGLEPLEGFGGGVAGTFGSLRGPLRSYYSPAQQNIFSYYTGTGTNANVQADGQQWRLTPQGYYYWGPFGLFGEYVISSQELLQAGGGVTKGQTATVANRAWEVSASWFITGEKNSWKPVTILKPVTFSSGSGWGALEVAARLQGLSFDSAIFPTFANPRQTPSGAFAWGLGVNWFLNRNLKVSLDYDNTDFHGGDLNPVTAQNEQTISGQLQLNF